MRALIAIVAAFLLFAPGMALAQDTPAAAPPPGGATTPSASDTTAPPPADAAPASQPANPPMTGPQILISTAMGDITLQLDSVRAPKSVASVLRYVRDRHYDGTVVYRVVKGFI